MLEVNKDDKSITCEDVFREHQHFELNYDKLIMAVGVRTNTFNIPGVEYMKNNGSLSVL